MAYCSPVISRNAYSLAIQTIVAYYLSAQRYKFSLLCIYLNGCSQIAIEMRPRFVELVRRAFGKRFMFIASSNNKSSLHEQDNGQLVRDSESNAKCQLTVPLVND